jgi:hypothetical protein
MLLETVDLDVKRTTSVFEGEITTSSWIHDICIFQNEARSNLYMTFDRVEQLQTHRLHDILHYDQCLEATLTTSTLQSMHRINLSI